MGQASIGSAARPSYVTIYGDMHAHRFQGRPDHHQWGQMGVDRSYKSTPGAISRHQHYQTATSKLYPIVCSERVRWIKWRAHRLEVLVCCLCLAAQACQGRTCVQGEKGGHSWSTRAVLLFMTHRDLLHGVQRVEDTSHIL